MFSFGWLRPSTLWSESWDPDHCAACWATFTEFDGPDIQHERYVTRDEYRLGACYEWVCKTCFQELQAEMGGGRLPIPGSLLSRIARAAVFG